MQKPDASQANQHSPVGPAIDEKRECIPGVNETSNRPDLSLDMANFFEDDEAIELGYLTLEFDIKTVVAHGLAGQSRPDSSQDADRSAPHSSDLPGPSDDVEAKVPGYITLELETDAPRAVRQSGAGLKSHEGQRGPEVEREEQNMRQDESSLEMLALDIEDELPAPGHLTLELDITAPDTSAASGQTKTKGEQSDLSRRPWS